MKSLYFFPITLLFYFTIGCIASQNDDNHSEYTQSKLKKKLNQSVNSTSYMKIPQYEEEKKECTDFEKKPCASLPYPCISCKMDGPCVYGNQTIAKCNVVDVSCEGETTFAKNLTCRFCYQTDFWEYTCEKSTCNSASSPPAYYQSNCTVNRDVLCLGKRKFLKRLRCNWTGGHRWSTALVLSITLGGFGIDRFYLGHWQEGIGKLFSFGGLGVWTLIDVLLISIRYLGPADGSLYI